MQNYTIGIDIGGTKTFLVVLDSNKNNLYEKKVSSSKEWKYLLKLICEALNQLKIAKNEIDGMGIGVASSIEPFTNKVVDAPALEWKQFDLVSILEPYFPFPIVIENDVNCALIGEYSSGSAKGCDSVFFISIGTGLGSAIMVNGKLIYGVKNMAGEIGYQLDKDDYKNGKLNAIGQFGITENKVSGTALGKKFFSSEKLFVKIKENDPSALKVFDEFLIDLCILISNIICLLNPEKVILGGGLSFAIEPYLDDIKEKVTSMVPVITQIELSKLGEQAVAFGAAINLSQKY